MVKQYFKLYTISKITSRFEMLNTLCQEVNLLSHYVLLIFIWESSWTLSKLIQYQSLFVISFSSISERYVCQSKAVVWKQSITTCSKVPPLTQTEHLMSVSGEKKRQFEDENTPRNEVLTPEEEICV